MVVGLHKTIWQNRLWWLLRKSVSKKYQRYVQWNLDPWIIYYLNAISFSDFHWFFCIGLCTCFCFCLSGVAGAALVIMLLLLFCYVPVVSLLLFFMILLFIIFISCSFSYCWLCFFRVIWVLSKSNSFSSMLTFIYIYVCLYLCVKHKCVLIRTYLIALHSTFSHTSFIWYLMSYW